jgi:D-alanine-D-alanine ligase-like ATP-grasp enzyme
MLFPFCDTEHVWGPDTCSLHTLLPCAICCQGVGGTWGGMPDALPCPPRVLDLEDWMAEAYSCGASVVLCLQGASYAASGNVQGMLECMGLAHTGARVDTLSMCGDRVLLSEVSMWD